MMEIFLEGKKLDVSKDEATLLTFSLDDIQDFSSRNTSFSKTIVLPGTANNNKVFGSIYDVKVANDYNPSGDNVETNFNAAVGADCLIFKNRLQVFKGTLRLLEVIVDGKNIEYEVAVFGELGGLVSTLGNTKLEDLDFSTYNHTWDATNVQTSWDNINGTGYFYPLIDYGNVSTAKVDYDIRAYRPALYVKEYIDKLFTAAGYSYDFPLMNTSRFKSLIIPNNQKSLQTIVSRLIYSTFVATNSGGDVIIKDEGPTSANVTFTSNTLSQFTYSGGTFTYTGSDTRTLTFNITISNVTWYSTVVDLLLRFKKNGTVQGSGYTLSSQSIPLTIDEIQISQEITVVTNDTVELVAEPVSVSGDYELKIELAEMSADLPVPTFSDLSPGNTIIMNDMIPRNILQVDFLASIIKLFNLYLYEDKLYPKKVLIKPYVDFYDLNVSGVVDWNYKIDRSKPIRLKPMSELNSRYYNFKYRPDNDYYNEQYRKEYNQNYGDYVYDSEYEFASNKTDVEIIFSPSVLIGYTGTDKVLPVLYKLQGATEEPFASNIRILLAKKITGVTGYAIKNGATNLATGVTNYGYGGHYDDPDAPSNDLNFGVPKRLYFVLLSGGITTTQFNVYWSPYMAEITDKDSKLMTCYAKLDNSDIASLDFSKLIYVDGCYWRLNKIEDWNAEEPDVCKIELLKVINLLY